MKKILILLILFLSCLSIYSQTTTIYSGTRVFTGIFRIAQGAQLDFKGNYIVDSQSGDTLATVEGMRAIIQQYTGESSAFNGNRLVTRSGLPAVNVGTSTISEFLNAYFFPSTSPTATISASGGTSREFMSTGADLATNLTWSATRPVACLPITAITVNGVSQSVMNPFVEGAMQNGTLNNQALPRNANTTYTINISSEDKSGTASATITWYWSRYWGAFSSAVPPTDGGFSISDAQIRALTGAGVGTGIELSTTRIKTYNGINGAGNYLVFAWPSVWGEPTFVINGLVSTAFTKVRSTSTFVNASGGSTTYDVWVSNTVQMSAISQFQIN